MVMGGESYWLKGTATWYGDVGGDGSDGGACGYGPLVHVRPYHGRVSAGNAALFQQGMGCGACFKVKCLDPSICRRRAISVIITDECPPGGACSDNQYHFDLSGPAFGRLAIPGMADSIRTRGEVPIVFSRTLCKYPGKNIAFHVDEGSTPYWLSILVEFENGEGDIESMSIKQANFGIWQPMRHVWGATWCIDQGPLQGPFSIKLTNGPPNQTTIIAPNVIPRDWAPLSTYTATHNF
ncbi:Expansin-B3 [Striga hermonthica]|uniref:Expansin-B3 n=1 Tax=Striga hermonthica TaxID=68872 RepID=A0A9N7R0J8_STRHE|nr:Expansin-B3 [Striga hermonthica]